MDAHKLAALVIAIGIAAGLVALLFHQIKLAIRLTKIEICKDDIIGGDDGMGS
jgi:hypothetical protein